MLLGRTQSRVLLCDCFSLFFLFFFPFFFEGVELLGAFTGGGFWVAAHSGDWLHPGELETGERALRACFHPCRGGVQFAVASQSYKGFLLPQTYRCLFWESLREPEATSPVFNHDRFRHSLCWCWWCRERSRVDWVQIPYQVLVGMGCSTPWASSKIRFLGLSASSINAVFALSSRRYFFCKTAAGGTARGWGVRVSVGRKVHTNRNFGRRLPTVSVSLCGDSTQHSTRGHAADRAGGGPTSTNQLELGQWRLLRFTLIIRWDRSLSRILDIMSKSSPNALSPR